MSKSDVELKYILCTCTERYGLFLRTLWIALGCDLVEKVLGYVSMPQYH